MTLIKDVYVLFVSVHYKFVGIFLHNLVEKLLRANPLWRTDPTATYKDRKESNVLTGICIKTRVL